MNRNPLVENNKEILKKLLKKDPVKYTNFDRVAEFVLEAPVDEENKSVTLHIMSKIFVGLNERDKRFQLGRNNNAAKIAEMNDLYTQTNIHIAAITRLIKPNPKINMNLFNALLNIIDYYIKNPIIIKLEKDYQKGMLDSFARLFLTYPYKSDKKKEFIINQLKTDLEFIKNSFFKVMNYKKNHMLRSLVSTYNKKAKTEEYKEALGDIEEYCKKITQTTYLNATKDNARKLEKMSKELSDAFQIIGLPLPKSLIRLSLLGIAIVEKNKSPKMTPGTKTERFYANDERFVLEGKYLERDFFLHFLDVKRILKDNKLSGTALAEKLDDKDSSFAKVSIILRKASAYIITNEFRYVYTNMYKQLGFSKELFAESLGYEYVNSEIEIYLEMFDNDILENMNTQVLNVDNKRVD